MLNFMTIRFRLNLILFSLVTCLPFMLMAQANQTLRGQVTDQLLQKPLAGATVFMPSQNKSTITDAQGNFRFTNVPIGIHQLRISYIGYRSAQLDNITLISGKEEVLNISLELDVQVQEEAVVKARAVRSKPLNELSLVSARAFSVEETQRYAAAVNDPLRMATSFAGVVAADDGNNNIVIRGNSPVGMLWRMEGVDIPNPNHYSVTGGSGGGISILSTQLLANSDFVTGAFAAEYGNAVSGVFDLRLRKGNNEKREYALQAGVLGLNLAAEGPFSSKYKGSYLVNYRYSTLGLLTKMGLEMQGGATTNFQDLSFNIFLPAKKLGTFTLFGFGGLSDQKYNAEKDPSKWEEEADRQSGIFKSNTGAMGITHAITLGQKTFLKSALVYSGQETGYHEKYLERQDSLVNTFNAGYLTKKVTFSSTLNQQINRRHSVRSGIILNQINFKFGQTSRDNPGEVPEQKLDIQDQTQTIQAFTQWTFKPGNQFTLTGGLHLLYLNLNKTSTIEPRAALHWDANGRNSFSIGYGLHSQIQPMGIYFARTPANGQWIEPNKELGLTRSHHFVLSWNRQVAKGLKLKSEIYYQHLFNVPVSIYDTSSFSTLNMIQGFATEALENKGKGKNYGLEISLEKQLRNYFYFLFSNSIYQSKYTGADGRERNTRFNGNYAGTFTAGKEFVHHTHKRSIGINIKTIYAGGYRTTPIDLPASIQHGYAKYIESRAFTESLPAYFRTDLRISLKMNAARYTSTFSLDIQNITNRKNVYDYAFDRHKGEMVTYYQTGILPIFNYKIEF